MTLDDRRDPVEALLASVRTAGILYGVFAVGYGLLTVIFGDALWGSGAYGLAQKIPAAPQSWGLVFAVFGIGILAGIRTRRPELIAASCWLSGVWCYVFAILFLADSFRRGEAFGITGFWLYTIFGTLVINRGACARKVGI
ncbi:membrane protein [Gordonia phage Vasanti]|uniref:Membrane protein n=1 Tax=Gordonia phage Vasanti TaxID=2502431 RepID=A0A411BVX8_9CAUD|nr:membrane protein [Gordonia phage Vasanti]QAY05758.1 membrane protein [Gordonia phage Vasanti]